MDFLGIDHLVLTVASIEKTLWFYCEVLGMKEIIFGNNRKALKCGNQKINLHEINKEFEPKALKPTPGSADICFIINSSVETAIQELKKHSVNIIEGPVEKTGTKGKLLSIYVRDPDGNLIEISNLL